MAETCLLLDNISCEVVRKVVCNIVGYIKYVYDTVVWKDMDEIKKLEWKDMAETGGTLE